ncbi:HAMP domain-containing sensor histidine kinase [Microcoleus sp. S13_C5]|uniref:HAMP domain-containing sensor histidine kinase n=1 Tax=Microcoleus sp. S13_C5 TaxID=3055411 RepID=UPI002FD28B31
MQEMWKTFFSSGSFIPHGHCYLWHTPLVWLHLASDSIIALAYFSIPITLVYFISKRQDLPFDWIFALFGAFLVACGITHIFEVWTLWHPTYWLSGTMKAITALISFATAILLVDLMPQALALPSPAQLESTNRLLESEIVDHQLAQAALQKAQVELEILLEQRTEELKSQAQKLEQVLSELNQARSQLIPSPEMSFFRQLLTELPHHIHNPIHFICGNLTYVREYVDSLLELVNLYQDKYPHPLPTIQKKISDIDLDFIKEDLPQILISLTIAADRLIGIVQSLRTGSRLDAADIKIADLHESMDSILKMLSSRLTPKQGSCHIEVIKEYGNLPKIECYLGAINQVFITIIGNAIEALEENSHSESVAASQPDPPNIKIATKLLENEQVEIRISNNGPEITESVMKQLFNPFFTTKPVGKQGIGLGLALSHAIITVTHQGELQCISAPGKGAEFIIKIPISLQ